MIATSERYNIKGFEAPRPITSEAQNEHYTTVLHDLVMRGHLNRKEEVFGVATLRRRHPRTQHLLEHSHSQSRILDFDSDAGVTLFIAVYKLVHHGS